MKLNVVFLINAIVSLLLGLGYILVPDQFASTYGLTLNAGGVYVARAAGALLIGYALIAWFVRNLDEADAKRAVLPGFFGGFLVTFLVSLFSQLTGGVNALAWFNVVITLAFALAYGYFLFMKPSNS